MREPPGVPEGSACFAKGTVMTQLPGWRFQRTVRKPSYCCHGHFFGRALLSVLQFSSTHVPESSASPAMAEAESRKLFCGELMARRASQLLSQEARGLSAKERPGSQAQSCLISSPSGPSGLASSFLTWGLLPCLNLEIFLRVNRLGLPRSSLMDSGILGILIGMDSFSTES